MQKVSQKMRGPDLGKELLETETKAPIHNLLIHKAPICKNHRHKH